MTGGGKLRAKHVIHAVGPRMGEGDEDKKLASAVRASPRPRRPSGPEVDRHARDLDRRLRVSDRPRARIILTEIQRYLQGGTKLERVVVVLHGEDAFRTFKREMRRGFR